MTLQRTRLASIYAIYSVCFLGAAFNHARDIALGGMFPYRDVPFFYNLFWTSLAFIDPLVPGLIILGKRKGALLLAVLIMVADVVINTQYAHANRESIYRGNVDLLAQTAFLVFVLVTAPWAWNSTK